MPGMFVRIRLPIGQPHPALLVIDRAIGSDQGLKYRLRGRCPEQDRVSPRRRRGRWRATDCGSSRRGLKPDDLVVVGGLQQVRPDMEIRGEQMPMPSLDGQGAESGANAGRPTLRPAAKKQAMISHFFIDRPIFATVLSIVITLTGGIALLSLPIAQYPQITPPAV